MKRFFLFLLSIVFSVAAVAQVTPAKMKKGSVLLHNGTVHVGNGKVIKDGSVAFEDGKLTYVGRAGAISTADYDTVIDAKGKHIYPGIIAPNSTLGLHEIGAVRATDDDSEVGSMNPNVRSIIAYNTDSRITPTVRTNGVLLAQITPRSNSTGSIAGTSSIVELDGWNWEDAVYKMDDGIHVYWPRMFVSSGWWAEPGGTKMSKRYPTAVEKLRMFFEEAKAYCEQDSYDHKDLKFEAMRGVFDGTKKVYFHSDYVKEITDLVFFARDFKVKSVLVGGYDSWMVTDLLRENDIPVMLRRLHSLPTRAEQDVDLPYKIPAMLQKDSVLFCLENSGDMEAMGTRNLPFYAGTAAAYGLTKEEALMSITLNTARILGIETRVGSLEKGKDATFFMSTGDALDMMSNNVELAFIQGKQIELNSEQIDLYKKYKAKYAGQQ